MKFLFVVDSFFKAGTERFTFEIHKALNKRDYQIDFLSLKNNGYGHCYLGNHQFYYQKHIELGATVFFMDNLVTIIQKPFWLRALNYVFCRIKLPLIKSYDISNKELIKMLNSYEIIHWQGEYTVLHQFQKNIIVPQIITITTSKFQFKNLYEKFDTKYPYNFLSGFSKIETMYELSEFTFARHFEFPLYFEIPNKKNNWKKQVLTSNKIAIFTRLNSYKPLDPFFYALQLVQNKEKNTELHIFGYGDPELEGMNRYIDRIGLTGVYFRGNVESIYETLENEYFDLSWFQGYNNDRPAGYAGLDVASFGLPLICWDFHPSPNKMENKVFPHYKNLETFVEKSLEILNDKEKAQELSKIQFEEIIQNWDIEKNIHKLEFIYQELLEN